MSVVHFDNVFMSINLTQEIKHIGNTCLLLYFYIIMAKLPSQTAGLLLFGHSNTSVLWGFSYFSFMNECKMPISLYIFRKTTRPVKSKFGFIDPTPIHYISRPLSQTTLAKPAQHKLKYLYTLGITQSPSMQ